MRKSSLAYILLGSNLGERAESLDKAIIEMERLIGPVERRSSLYETAAIGIPEGPMFLNAVVAILTALKPQELLTTLLTIERDMGRVRTGKVTSRPIDLDIGFYDQLVIEEDDLIIPHPRLHLRRFALAPLVEIAPEYVHPVFQITLKELLDTCVDQSEVSILSRP